MRTRLLGIDSEGKALERWRDGLRREGWMEGVSQTERRGVLGRVRGIKGCGAVHRKGIPMITLAMRNAVGPYSPFARSLIMEDRSSKYAGIYATAYDQ